MTVSVVYPPVRQPKNLNILGLGRRQRWCSCRRCNFGVPAVTEGWETSSMKSKRAS